MSVILTPTAALFDGPCMLLGCHDLDPHGHDICPTCTAVRFGNQHCRTCVERQAANGREWARELLRRWPS